MLAAAVSAALIVLFVILGNKGLSKTVQNEVADGKIPEKPIVLLSDEELAKIPTDLYREGAIYYGDTHAHPHSSFAYTTSSLLDLMSFDVINNIELINQPLLMLVGDKADTAYMSRRIFENASGTKNKELYELKDATHIQTYFKQDAVNEAVSKLDEFYKNNLK